MKWVNHIAIGGALVAPFKPELVPVAVLGATAPDWLEYLSEFMGNKIKHRTTTHYVSSWLAGCAFSLLLFDWNYILFGFFLGGLTHVFCDAMTVSGVPFSQWSRSNFHLFGGRLRTGNYSEYVVAGAVCLIMFGVATQLRPANSTFIPFFFNWYELYQKGDASAYELKTNRLKFF